MLTDDLPWPELGNVSRGATRGNQGQKGVLGPPDNEGRCLLQLRVQPGVLAVRLNRQASDWYRTLDTEVNRALKLTKTYWRKARRRQDYDARADQDHMELHEWLQQLKDKVMSHLEVLMQKGEIQGPPYLMPDNIELTFLRKFIERQAAGIPHNPRLRRALGQNRPGGGVDQQLSSKLSVGSSPSISLAGCIGFSEKQESHEDDTTPGDGAEQATSHSLLNEVNLNRRNLASARAAFFRAQRETQESFARYTSCLEAEAQARQQLSMLEERRDALMASLAESFRTDYMDYDIQNTLERSDSRASTSQSHDEVMNAIPTGHVALQDNVAAWKTMRDMQWSHGDAMAVPDVSRGHHELASVDQTFSPAARGQEMQMNALGQMERKHPRSWEELQSQTAFEVSDSRLYPAQTSWQLLGRYAPQ
ncbi:hypothetical protein DICSQDRAFT_164012 [Dichomitus squalens LYAD-421 SS1]|uniref:Uncharacterized protein n=2 Tax=Dichomitus squalens TaxID=114155 RepID=A0A4Q9PKV4_9APHY|nr:uncharacterized protein DICSQDRAFT_164012 [Dichomitus squalens LYAD-421 SS1]EJF56086.1 hypothetical protein DICSQDRAFT_164012 [Dichomitus squalens LYAD-421 SS1]TBU54745.1 hypothetical protein BD310DRAFT_827359 [Dichomitus squalens]